MFGAQVRLSWPLLTSSLAFPLTQVGNTTRRTLVISNPGTHDHLMVQLVLENTYPSASSLVNSLPQRYNNTLSRSVTAHSIHHSFDVLVAMINLLGL